MLSWKSCPCYHSYTVVVYAGRVLKPTRTLGYYQITNGCTIHVLRKKKMKGTLFASPVANSRVSLIQCILPSYEIPYRVDKTKCCWTYIHTYMWCPDSFGSGDLLSSWGGDGDTLSVVSVGSFGGFLGGRGRAFVTLGEVLPSVLVTVSTASRFSTSFVEVSVLAFTCCYSHTARGRVRRTATRWIW